MLETFKAQLKAYLQAKKVNLSQKRIDAFADKLHAKFPDVTEAADYDTHIETLAELVDFADIAKTDDRVRTLENKPNPPKPAEPGTPTDTPTDTPADDTKALLQQLLEKVNKLEGEKRTVSVKQTLAEKLKDIPADFYDEWQLPEKEEDLEPFAERVKAKWEKVAPAAAPQQPQRGHQPQRSVAVTDKGPSKEEIAAVVKKLK